MDLVYEVDLLPRRIDKISGMVIDGLSGVAIEDTAGH
jgi:hypothetical protein